MYSYYYFHTLSHCILSWFCIHVEHLAAKSDLYSKSKEAIKAYKHIYFTCAQIQSHHQLLMALKQKPSCLLCNQHTSRVPFEAPLSMAAECWVLVI